MRRAVVWCAAALTPEMVAKVNATADLVVQQKTPVRVLHRRSLAVRPKTIHAMRLEPINAHFATLKLTTQAGTYIKEFVHGDLGRTAPSLGALLACDCDILQLDVTDVVQDWPPACPHPISTPATGDSDTTTQ
jgi:tRNA pseudouridine synthase 10